MTLPRLPSVRFLTAALAFAMLGTACSGTATSTTTTTIAPIDIEPTARSVSPSTIVSTTNAPAAVTTTVSPATTQATRAAVTDPASRSNTWIAVLASLDVEEYDQVAAQAEAQAIGASLDPSGPSDVELLLSDDYASLNDGFWVVHLGGFRDEFQADEACGSVEGDVPECYTRRLELISPDEAVGYQHGYIVAVLENGPLGVIDAASGVVVRTDDNVYYGDGAFPGSLTLSADGASVFYTVGFEDFWFDCDASDGTLLSLDLGGGEPQQIADGFSPAAKPDGSVLLYLASSQCIEDPNEPQFVLTPIDTVVRRSLMEGGEERDLLPLEGDLGAGYEFFAAGWGPEGAIMLLDTEGTLYRLDQELTELADFEGFGWSLVGYQPNNGTMLIRYHTFDGEATTTQLVAVDPGNGDTTIVETFDGIAAAALDATGNHLVIATEDTLWVDGTAIEIDYRIVDLAW